jgi:hypothetical protein
MMYSRLACAKEGACVKGTASKLGETGKAGAASLFGRVEFEHALVPAAVTAVREIPRPSMRTIGEFTNTQNEVEHKSRSGSGGGEYRPIMVASGARVLWKMPTVRGRSFSEIMEPAPVERSGPAPRDVTEASAL